MPDVLTRYGALVAAHELRPDSDQLHAAERLHRLADELAAAPEKGSVLWRMLRKAPAPPRGIYMWGGVGRGKSMLMDLAYEHIDFAPKRRVHFHEFMIEVHARLRKARETEEGDQIERVAEQIADYAKLLCFDEMQVTNPADAMILSRLFRKLIDEGVRVVTTSNRPPRDLYKDGLNRDVTLPVSFRGLAQALDALGKM